MIADPTASAVCIREIQKDLRNSSKKLIEDKIHSLGLLPYFDIQRSGIYGRNGRQEIVFQGMQDHTSDSVKSLENYKISWVEEAQNLSQRSLDLLRPTLRRNDSELYFSWNPRFKTDPVDKFFRGDFTESSMCSVKVNYTDNPWCPDVLLQEAENDKKRDYEKYSHVWLGEYETHSEANVFNNWRVADFDAPEGITFRYGADWGFSQDPTVIIRCYIVGNKLFIDYEASMVGCEIIHTPQLFLTVPDSEKWPIVADSSRPETISYMRSHGFPKMMASIKGKNSIEEGIEFIKSYDVYIHPRCQLVIEEFSKYRYKVDSKSGVITPYLEDKFNHSIDALRYALEGERRLKENNEPTRYYDLARGYV
jgi:phage terminase large subunit